MSEKFDRRLISGCATGAILVLALFLTACGGDSGSGSGSGGNSSRNIDLQGAKNPAPLDSPTAAAQAFVTLKAALNVHQLSMITAKFMDQASSPGASKKCPGGGTLERSSGGLAVARQCKVSKDNSPAKDSVLLGLYDGKINPGCSATCTSYNLAYGSNNGEGTPFLRTFESGEFLFLGSVKVARSNINGVPVGPATLNEKMAVKTGKGNTRLTFFTHNFIIDANTSKMESWNGVIGFGEPGSQVNCTVGQLTVKTLDRIGPNLQQGKLSFRNSEGQKATVSLKGGGSIDVTMNGDTKTFKKDALKGYCNY